MTSQPFTPSQSAPLAFAWAGAILTLLMELRRPVGGQVALAAIVVAMLLMVCIRFCKAKPVLFVCCALLGACFTSMSYFLTLHL